MNRRLFAAALLDVLAIVIALRLTRWRGVERQIVLEFVVLGLSCLAIAILIPALKHGSTAQVLAAILFGFPPLLVLANAIFQFAR